MSVADWVRVALSVDGRAVSSLVQVLHCSIIPSPICEGSHVSWDLRDALGHRDPQGIWEAIIHTIRRCITVHRPSTHPSVRPSIHPLTDRPTDRPTYLYTYLICLPTTYLSYQSITYPIYPTGSYPILSYIAFWCQVCSFFLSFVGLLWKLRISELSFRHMLADRACLCLLLQLLQAVCHMQWVCPSWKKQGPLLRCILFACLRYRHFFNWCQWCDALLHARLNCQIIFLA